MPKSRENVLPTFCSLLIPGSGQLLQARIAAGVGWFLIAGLAWATLLTENWDSVATVAPFIHLWSSVDAAKYLPPISLPS